MKDDNPDSPVLDPRAAPNHVWTARVIGGVDGSSTAYTRNHSIDVGGQASFAETSAKPSATDYLLAALGGDLISGFSTIASRRGIVVHAVEARVSGHLNNPLVLLGVVGETGSPGFEAINVALYVSSDADEPALEEIWQETVMRSPLVNTLKQAVDLVLELKSTV